ncbi:tubulin--tyrosine ligase-like protein 12 [Haliotis rubra]|uniref:tubulin--tyrosine ligase-like protein 12 n=1 Tax=Haliotis rubra TaxID=36100 RepID=UPI001EE577B9|nr:tubulin--tyrosine ligase-like protein 12 [Haliotis rubra]
MPVTTGDSQATVMSFSDFVELHKPQLLASAVPERFWNTLFEKLKDEVYDAGDNFQIICEQYVSEDNDEDDGADDHGWKVIVYTDDGISHTDEKNIFLIDHAWTFRVRDARQYLEEVPGLLERMTALIEVSTAGKSSDEQNEAVLRKMWKYTQTYSFGHLSEGSEDSMPIWYVMDEFGSRIQHSNEPSFRTVPFYFLPRQMAFNIMWPLRDLDHGEEVTRDYLPNVRDALVRRARLTPWIDDDLTDVSCEQTEPDMSYFQAYRENESLPNLDVEFPPVPTDRSLKVYMDYGKMLKDHLTDPRFQLVEDITQADVIWTHRHYKDFKELSEEFPGKFVNQFPFEMTVTIKDLLAIVSRRAAKKDQSQNASQPSPKWLPVTYNLQTELPQFVSYFQHREAQGLDNTYICKPWNLARGLDMDITDNLDHIVKLPDGGPKVVCKYIEDPVLFHRDDVGMVKYDIRYIVLLSSVKPLKLFAYNVFWLRFANKPYSLDHFDDYDKHFTVMNYREESPLKQIHYDEYIKMFEKQYPDFSWDGRGGEDIFTMFRELFEAASSLPHPRASAPPQSRAMYAIDLMLKWDKNDKGERYMQPQICEVNFSPDCDRACQYHPFFINDVMSVLLLDDTVDKHVTLVS